MQRYSLTHLADATLLADGRRSARQESVSTAALLAHIAEIDRRRLYADEGFDSMSAFCVAEWGLCEFAAYRRIAAARAAREFPALFEAVAGGRLTLTSVVLLTPALTQANAAELIAAATNLTKRELQELLADRAAKAEAATCPAVASPGASCGSLAPALVAPNGASEEAARMERPTALAPTAAPVPRQHPLHALLGKAEFEDLEYLKALLAHVEPSGDLTAVLGRVFRAAIRELERGKFAVTSRTRPGKGGTGANPRHIPAAVRRAVFARDGGACTFVSANGRRCGSRTRLQFDHVTPVARGGPSTADNLRLRCHTHNQRAAEQVFGADFMARKRAAARLRSEAGARAAAAERARREARTLERAVDEAARARAEEVMPWLRTLGFRAAEARRAALASGAALADASLEERVKHALRSLAPPGARKVMPFARDPA